MSFGESEDRSILDYFSFIVADAGVERLADGAFRSVPCDHASAHPHRVLTAQVIFEQRRYIDESSGIPDRMVFIVMHDFVGTGDEISRPSAPVLTHTQRRSS